MSQGTDNHALKFNPDGTQTTLKSWTSSDSFGYSFRSQFNSDFFVIEKRTEGASLQLEMCDLDGTVLETEYTLGDYVFLPEPFYFNQSIVKYNNQVWQCIISNNDTDFIIGKWELLNSGSRKLNELDRIIGYYDPTTSKHLKLV